MNKKLISDYKEKFTQGNVICSLLDNHSILTFDTINMSPYNYTFIYESSTR